MEHGASLKVSQRTGAGIVDSQELVLVPTPAKLQLFSRILQTATRDLAFIRGQRHKETRQVQERSFHPVLRGKIAT